LLALSHAPPIETDGRWMLITSPSKPNPSPGLRVPPDLGRRAAGLGLGRNSSSLSQSRPTRIDFQISDNFSEILFYGHPAYQVDVTKVALNT
jgi:hypothetical protein